MRSILDHIPDFPRAPDVLDVLGLGPLHIQGARLHLREDVDRLVERERHGHLRGRHDVHRELVALERGEDLLEEEELLIVPIQNAVILQEYRK